MPLLESPVPSLTRRASLDPETDFFLAYLESLFRVLIASSARAAASKILERVALVLGVRRIRLRTFPAPEEEPR